jgi:hypothetical protein
MYITPDRKPDFKEVKARIYFYNLIHQHLEKDLSYAQFWDSKEKGILEIKSIIEQINEQYFLDEKSNPYFPSQNFFDFQGEKVNEIKKILKLMSLDIDIGYERLFSNLEINVIKDEYEKYQKDPENCSFYTLEPLKTDKRELILQIENEIKNRVWKHYNSEERQNKTVTLNDTISSFKSIIDEKKYEDVIEKILSKYTDSKVFHFTKKDSIDRFNSLDKFIMTKIDTDYFQEWDILRHYLKWNFVSSQTESVINEIIYDAELLRRLGYFDDITPSVSSLIHSNFNLNDAKGMKINFIRVINTLYELNFFVNKDNEILHKKDVMKSFGEYLGVDLSNYDKDLSQAINIGESDKNTMIFDKMKKKMNDYIDEKLEKKTD